ncbi:MAG: ankyrin repeat domain-containing protein [Planctomycetaceae bacterium]|nr:ankyrin repeat domain-containing protein [Planctomycetaceae bacterium]
MPELNAGDSMNFRDFKQVVRSGDLAKVERILNANSDFLHTYDPDGDQWEERTALHCAARHGHLEIVRLLVERGSEIYSNPMNSYPAVFIADCYRYHANRPNTQHIVDYFLKEIPDRAEGTNGLGATINIAARQGWTDIVRRHIEIDPLSVHQRGWIGDTPLHWSCHNGHEEIVRLLLDAGADIEADEINCYGGKPLHWASEHEPQIVQLLLDRGAEVNSLNHKEDSDFFGITPLMMNVLMKDDCAEVTRLLLDAGADRSVAFEVKTIAQIAEEKGNARILQVIHEFSEEG